MCFNKINLVVDTGNVDETIAGAMWKLKLSASENPPKIEVMQSLSQIVHKGTYLVVSEHHQAIDVIPEGSTVDILKAQNYWDDDLEIDAPSEYTPGPTHIAGAMRVMAFEWPFDTNKASVVTSYFSNGARQIDIQDQAYLQAVFQACYNYLVFDTPIGKITYENVDVGAYLDYLRRIKMLVTRSLRTVAAKDGDSLRRIAFINIAQEEGPWATKIASSVYDDVVTYCGHRDGTVYNLFSRTGRVNEYTDQSGKPFNLHSYL